MATLEIPDLATLDASSLLEAGRAALGSLQWPSLPGAELALLATLAMLALGLSVATLALRRRRHARLRALEARSEESANRVQALEVLLADMAAEAALLRQRVGELASRQDSLSTGSARAGLRQAIALSRHGATTRQLIETCSLSQGEAHLIQTLYGRPAGDAAPAELH
jgi:hypothetical protein